MPQQSLGPAVRSLAVNTFVGEYEAVESDGSKTAAARSGVEVNDSAIPDWTSNAVTVGWHQGDWDAAWTVRHISAVEESCARRRGDAGLTGCSDRRRHAPARHRPGTYHDLQVAWNNVVGAQGLKLTGGVNNLFDKEPPVCVTCSLNGYDASHLRPAVAASGTCVQTKF